MQWIPCSVIECSVFYAGIIKRIPMEGMAVEDFRRVIDVDLVAPFICAKAVIPGMIKKGHGKIINIRGCRIWDSREAGPPPRTSAPQGASRSGSNTVQPVAAPVFCAWPTEKPPTSIPASPARSPAPA